MSSHTAPERNEIVLETQAGRPTVTMRFRAPMQGMPKLFSGCFAALSRYLEQQGQIPAGPRFAIYRKLDGTTAEIEAGFPVAVPIEGGEDVVSGNLPAGDAATCTHVGPYNELGAKYAELALWITRRGMIIDGPFTEFYLNDPETTLPELLETKIVIPVRRDVRENMGVGRV